MASDQSYVVYVCEQASLGSSLSYKKMFGEFALYLEGKVVALVCDNQLFLKPTPAGKKMLGVVVVFWVPRGSHTIGDLLVHLPDDTVLIAGEVLVSRVVPTLQDGFVKNRIQTLDEMQALGVTHFVPGHGDLMTLRDVTDLRDTMFHFYSGVKQGFRKP